MNEYSDEFLAEVDLATLSQAQGALLGAFIWDNSPQGHEAWATVYRTLGEIYRAAEAAKTSRQEAQ